MIALVCCSVSLLFLVAVITLRAKTPAVPVPRSGIDIFELSARYRPMLRLLEGNDLELLAEAGDPKLLRRVRAQRRDIFRSYLRGLRRDHSVVCHQIRQVMVDATSDRKDLVSALVRLQMTFRFRMAMVEVRLCLHAAGLGSVTAAPLVNAFEQVSSEAKLLSASPLTLAA